MFEFWKKPRIGEVYTLGGGKQNACSSQEAFKLAEEITGRPMKWRYIEENRIGDHICYYSDLRKMKSHFATWQLTKSLEDIFREIANSWEQRMAHRTTK